VFGRAVPDAAFELPRLAQIYDPLDPDRSDLDVYAEIVREFAAQRVLDLGCGTGTFACLLAARGLEVVGVDPAAASLDVARRKPHADRVRWVLGDATVLPELACDLATMTGNVAQVFLTDADWHATLHGVRAALRPGGRLVLETRIPARRAWEDWNREQTWTTRDVPGAGVVETWNDLLDVSEPFVTFRWTTVFHEDGAVLTSESTLRFRGREEVEQSLQDSGFEVEDVRGAPDRPGREFVFVARSTAA
jgi:SAM-dependent methyltransferase